MHTITAIPAWTWLYRTTFTQQQQRNNKDKTELIVGKVNVPPFSQLIFSWNIMRPKQGYFTIEGQTRNVRTKQWTPWLLMARWGADIQSSYASKSADAHFEYVRWEAEPDLADAFRIRITPHEGASLEAVKGCAVNTSHLKLFTPQRMDELLLEDLTSFSIENVPKLSQFEIDHPRKDELCSPTACSMLIGFLASKQADSLVSAQKVYDKGLNIFGSWPYNTAYVFEACEGVFHCFVMRMHSFADLYAVIRRGIPVIVSVRGAIPGAPRPYPNGHLMVVVGFDSAQLKVIVHDPAAPEQELVRQSYDLMPFVDAWERSRRLAYVAAPIQTG